MFENIKKTLDRGMVSVSVKSGTYLEIEKLKTKAENAAVRMNTAASEMGAAVYDQWKNGSVSMEYIENVCTNIKGMEDEIGGYQSQIRMLEQEKARILGGDVQGAGGKPAEKVCTCGCVNQAEARFCAGCGKPLDVPEKQTAAVCPSCGMAAEPGARFCMGCGKPLEEQV